MNLERLENAQNLLRRLKNRPREILYMIFIN